MVRLSRSKLDTVTRIRGSVSFDLRIRIEGIASFILVGIAGTQLKNFGPQLSILGIELLTRSADVTGILAVQAGLKQVDLHIADGEGVVRGLRIGEVREGAADDKRRDEHDCDGNHKNGFLLHM